METLQKRIGGRLRALRNQQDVTLEQLAEASGLPPETISRIERGRSSPSLRSLERLAVGLGLSLAELLGGDAVTEAGGLPPEVRGIALLLAGAPAPLLDKARRIVAVLVEGEHAAAPPRSTLTTGQSKALPKRKPQTKATQVRKGHGPK